MLKHSKDATVFMGSAGVPDGLEGKSFVWEGSGEGLAMAESDAARCPRYMTGNGGTGVSCPESSNRENARVFVSAVLFMRHGFW